MGERLDVSRLHDIFGIGIIVHDRPCGAEQPPVMASHDLADRHFLVRKSTRNEGSVRSLCQTLGTDCTHAVHLFTRWSSSINAAPAGLFPRRQLCHGEMTSVPVMPGWNLQ